MPNLMRRLGPYSLAATTDDEWRDHARRVSNALAAVGLQRVKALDFAALAAPTAGSGGSFFESSAYVEVFEFGGPLRTSANLRVLVYHGRQTNPAGTVYNPQLRYQFLGINGHFSWPLHLTRDTGQPENPTVSTAWVASDGENWLTYRWGIENAAPSGLASGAVERTHGTDGSYSGDGAYFSHGHAIGANSGQGSGMLLRGSTGQHPASVFNWSLLPAYPVQSSLRNGRVAAFPHTVPVPGMPPHSVYAGYPADWTLNEEVQLEGRPYVVVGLGQYPTHSGTGSVVLGNFRTLVRLGDQVV